MDPPANMNFGATNYYHELADFHQVAHTVHEVNQMPTPQDQVITHASIRLHTETEPPTLMLVISQIGNLHYPLIALNRVDLSTLSMEDRAQVLAHIIVHAIHSGDLARPSVLMAETEQLTDLINNAFFDMGCMLEARVSSPGEDASVEHKWLDLMRQERAAGVHNHGRRLLRWQLWNQGSG